MEPYYRFKSWLQLQGSYRACTHTHTYTQWYRATCTDVLDLFSPLQMNSDTDTQTQSQRFHPLCSSDYIKHPGCSNIDGTNIPPHYQCKCQELWETAHHTGVTFEKMWVDHTAFTVTDCHEHRACVVLTEERATVTTHTNMHQHQHTHLRWSKYFTLPGCSPLGHSTQFSPLTSTHIHTQWSSLIILLKISWVLVM